MKYKHTKSCRKNQSQTYHEYFTKLRDVHVSTARAQQEERHELTFHFHVVPRVTSLVTSAYKETALNTVEAIHSTEHVRQQFALLRKTHASKQCI